MVDAAMSAYGCGAEILIENHLAAAIAACTRGRPDSTHFARVKQKLDDLEVLLTSSPLPPARASG
jgi:hypothetical protein